jgi:hypothetical protein
LGVGVGGRERGGEREEEQPAGLGGKVMSEHERNVVGKHGLMMAEGYDVLVEDR